MLVNIGYLNRPMLKRFSFFLIALSFFLAPFTARAADQDVGFIVSNFYFSETPLIVGEEVRMYASIKNFGDTDMAGFVTFKLSGELLTEPISFKSVAGGAIDNVFVDFTVPSEDFNILVSLGGMVPDDQNSQNNSYLSPIYEPLRDSDRDGIADEFDNCPLKSNVSQRDSDDDGIGNECDDTPFPPEPEPVVIAEPVEVPPFGLTEEAEEEPEPVQEVQEVPPAQPVAEPAAEVAGEVNATGAESVDSESADLDESEEEAKVVAAGPDGSFIAEENLIAAFSVERVHWNTYAFKALGDAPANYTWEFSDGTVLDGREVDHVFSGYGEYEVTLTVAESDGQFTSQTRLIEISFFHFDNPLFIVSFLLTILIIITGAVFAVKNR